jgi:hypothetical protein
MWETARRSELRLEAACLAAPASESPTTLQATIVARRAASHGVILGDKGISIISI